MALSEDILELPVFILRSATRNFLSHVLNGVKVIPSPAGLIRDWRGLAHIAGIACASVDSQNPTLSVLHQWERQKPPPKISDLIESLERIDRFDVIDDISSMIVEDGNEYLRRKVNGHNVASITDSLSDAQVLTIDDVYLLEQGLPPQEYDAFVLYADDEEEFASQVVNMLESSSFGLKLCLKNRDLIGGITFEHEAIMRLIAERCKRMIVFFSRGFFSSETNKFFVAFAQAMSIEQRKRTIIPCAKEWFGGFPVQLSCYYILYLKNAGSLFDFCLKLSKSVGPSSTNMPRMLPEQSSCRITELASPTPSQYAIEPSAPQIRSEQSDNDLNSQSEKKAESVPDYPSGSSDPAPSEPSTSRQSSRSKPIKQLTSVFQKLILPSPPTTPPGTTRKKWFKKKKSKPIVAQ